MPINELTPRQLKQRLDVGEDLLLLDIREDFELLICQLPGASHIPLSEMGARWQEIPRDRPVVIFCHAGVRSYNLVSQLAQAGFNHVINLSGGIDAWSTQVDPSVPRY